VEPYSISLDFELSWLEALQAVREGRQDDAIDIIRNINLEE
jgi:hypothetical protein